MDLIHTPKQLKNFRKTGVPYDSKSSAWISPKRTLPLELDLTFS